MVKIRDRPERRRRYPADAGGKIDEKFDGRPILEGGQAGPARHLAPRRRAQHFVARGARARELHAAARRARSGARGHLGRRRQSGDDDPEPARPRHGQVGEAAVRLPELRRRGGAQHSLSADAATTHAPTCTSCGAKMEFDGFSEEYLPHNAFVSAKTKSVSSDSRPWGRARSAARRPCRTAPAPGGRRPETPSIAVDASPRESKRAICSSTTSLIEMSCCSQYRRRLSYVVPRTEIERRVCLVATIASEKSRNGANT